MTQHSVEPDGPIPAKIMIVGEAPGADEEIIGRPFVGASGAELCKMLNEAGIRSGDAYWSPEIGKYAVRWLPSECFVTNVCRIRPPGNDIEFFIRESLRFTKIVTKADQKKLDLGIDPKNFVRFRDRLVHTSIFEGARRLMQEIARVQPNIIIPVGNLSMWVLTGKWGIKKWRGSMLTTDERVTAFLEAERKLLPVGGRSRQEHVKVLPTFHPAAVLRQWDWRAITISDLRRAKRYKDGDPYPTPKYNFILRPSFDRALNTLDDLIGRACLRTESFLRLSFDIETRAGHIACAGISWTYFDAICLPLMCVERRAGYWNLDEEIQIISRLRRLLTHPRVQVVGQNIIYDSQYTWRFWGFVPNVAQDTMISQHSLFSDLQKGLDFISSMYNNFYLYWKDEGKDWDPSVGEEQLWHYNCLDCVNTDEAGQVLLSTAAAMNMTEVHQAQQEMFWPVLQAMQTGVLIDIARRQELIAEVSLEISRRKEFLSFVLGFPLNPDSPKQMHTLFFKDFAMPIQLKRGKKGEPSKPTLDDDALQKLVRLEPLLRPVVNAISDIRTLGKFLSNFLCRALDTDGRMRCAFNIGGSASGKSAPKTYRLSSSENAFGSGTNLQNIPSEKSKSLGKAAARGGISGLGDPYLFPNIREIFIPDPGYTWFDLDLERADLFVVCWEAEDEQLKAAMRLGTDIHLLNAFVITGKEPPPLEELVETHPRYYTHRGPMKMIREFAKVFCHGTNYGGKSQTMAAHTGRTVHEIDRAQRTWFGAHPGILRWHTRVKDQITRRHFIENRFGYRWYIFDRIDSIVPEAIAWIPQSTVSLVINKIWKRIYREQPEVKILLQVHDSLPGQFPTAERARLLPAIRECSKIVVPYPDPLIIPVSIKTSEKSWGHC